MLKKGSTLFFSTPFVIVSPDLSGQSSLFLSIVVRSVATKQSRGANEIAKRSLP